MLSHYISDEDQGQERERYNHRRHDHRGHREFDDGGGQFRGHGTGDRGNRGSRPSGLRGREIGLWYARKSNAKKQQDEMNQVLSRPKKIVWALLPYLP